MVLKHTNPSGLSEPRGYTHVVEATGSRLLFIAGQVAVDAKGNFVGVGDFAAQINQVYENLKICLEAHGATFENVTKTTTFVVNYTAAYHRPIIAVARAKHLPEATPPASTLVGVQALAAPEILVEIEATAVI